MNQGLNSFKKLLGKKKVDGFIVTNPVNILYLSDFKGVSPTERESILIFSPNPTLVTARLYQNEAKKLESKNLKVKIVNERNEIPTHIKKLFKKGLPPRSRRRRLGFEEQNLTYSEFKEFKKALPDVKFAPYKNLIEDLRVVKTAEEIAKIEKAQTITERAFGQLIKTIKLGQTEAEIAETLSKIIKSLGADGLAFESIIASGPNSGLPHYVTGKKKIKKGEVLLLDIGAIYKNYCADFSRTVFIGKTNGHQRNIFNLVAKAQKKALAKIKRGIKASQIFEAAHSLFKDQKLDKYFLHGLGHGVGLQIHEKPSLRPIPKQPDKNFIDETLTENMVFSIEPGLYFPWGGVRIEDLVVIKNSKAKLIGNQLAEFIEI